MSDAQPQRFSPRLRSQASSVSDLTRRRSATERINEILDAGRSRADLMDTSNMSPYNQTAPPERHLSPFRDSPLEESSADEGTHMVARNSTVTHPAPDTDLKTTRSRRSIYSRQSRVPSRSDPPPVAADDADQVLPALTPQRPWLDRTFEKFQAIELENKGSVARDHLAIERTFLAWLRTSLAFASIGIAVTQLFRLNTSLSDNHGDINVSKLRHLGKPLGAAFLAISILILMLGYKRYFQSQEWVIKGKFPASRGTITIVALVALAIMLGSLVVVIAIHPSESS